MVVEQNIENSVKHGAIIHGWGTILGLDDPDNGGNDSGLNVDDTVMSYETGESGWNTNFTEADIESLSRIWGLENDSKPDDITLSKSNINENISSGSTVATLSTSIQMLEILIPIHSSQVQDIRRDISITTHSQLMATSSRSKNHQILNLSLLTQ